ncbi:MAG: sigma-54-dependent Fis family transcriptional regulator [Deltaproteobacteria bacterium]|nr:sigma-54-dependent Fis family transcriptional regulator [Deltaproteobacteria bacterium]
MTLPRVLFIDDQPAARELFLRMLDPQRYEASVAASVAEAEEAVHRAAPDVAITDLRMPGVDGLEALARLHRIAPELPIVVVSAFGTVDNAVEAMKKGAFDFLRKPFDRGEIELVIQRALRQVRILKENASLRSQVERTFRKENIVCRSAAMSAVIDLIERVAPSDVSVLIQGESGTGKDLVAKLVHHSSHRADGPFVSLNCSAIPEQLLESELFGYEKGAFSGADHPKTGFFVKADRGTLFLDEIGDMSLALQPKLLRVLQDGEFYPVGGRQLVRTNVRLICASNQNLQKMIEQNRFRQDLLYRINTVSLVLPPLRERPEDIPLLVEAVLGSLRARRDHTPRAVSAPALRCLLEYRWPGNVRELEHVIERAVLVCDGDEIQPQDLPPELRAATPAAGAELASRQAQHAPIQSYKVARGEFEQRYFSRVLDEAGQNVQRAAELAGLHRTTLYEKLAKLGLHVERPGRPDTDH